MQLVLESARTADGTLLPSIGASPLVERRPLCVRADDRLGDVLARLLDSRSDGAPVLDPGGRYVGACTLRRIAELCLVIAPDTGRWPQSFAFLREDVEDIRDRLNAHEGMRAADSLDAKVPVIKASDSLPHALALLSHDGPFLSVLDDCSGGLIGVVTLNSALSALHQGGPAAGGMRP